MSKNKKKVTRDTRYLPKTDLTGPILLGMWVLFGIVFGGVIDLVLLLVRR